ncbi:MAG TPA: UDP-N-acetylglucosamine 2-epimerase (non-hydrolyzing) [Ignavibacteriales bacterium]|nr:UDP-N-acetylglucosamine 2-epimerase (non-hydrolyzing) [Ignavibacteriales bacterium]
MKKISFVFGTRPEAIKLAPVIIEMKKHPEFEVNVCVTAQHREMLDQVLEVFNIKPDFDLNLMTPDQTLANLTAEAIVKLDNYFKTYKPDLVFVQGDTTSVLAASIAAFYNNIRIAHVEAGLRTFNKSAPFPEEINRVLTSHIADLHFAPTETAKNNLIKEGITEEKIFVTGNTVIDALFHVKDIVSKNPPEVMGVNKEILDTNKPIVLITGHRRENFGKGFENICAAIAELADEFKDHYYIYPVHLNPNVRKPVNEILGNKKNILLIEPLSYLPFVYLMTKAKIILTDSGGIQEEAPSLGKPVLVMRDVTERPEAVETGCVKLVGTDKIKIIDAVKILLTSDEHYKIMQMIINPYGDGKASNRIIKIIQKVFEIIRL